MVGGNVYANYSVVELATDAYLQTGYNLTMTHDTFPYYVGLNWWSTIQPFETLPGPKSLAVVFENNTIGTQYYNATLEAQWSNYSSGAAHRYPTSNFDFAQGYGAVPADYAKSGSITVSHNTFEPRAMGPMSYLFLIDEPYVNQNVTSNLFANNLAFDQGPSRLTSMPFSSDIAYHGTFLNLTGNWFLDLSNATVPFFSLPYSGNADPRSSTQVRLSGNRYFYSVWDGESGLYQGGPQQGRFFGPASRVESITGDGYPVDSSFAYGVTLTANGTMEESDTATLVFNESLQVKSPIVSGESYAGPNSANSTIPWGDWAYGVAPDVNASTGVPVVAYSNGLAAGPQPNFFWDGYNYSEQVEPSYIEIGVNSSAAPPVQLVLQEPAIDAGQTMALYVTNNYTGQSSGPISVTLGNYGQYVATYNPATDPAEVIFSLGPLPGCTGPNCRQPSPPSGTHGPTTFTFTFAVTLFFVVGAILMAAGVVTIFFAKGVVVVGGIMFAIGLGMLVLGGYVGLS
jgi:hypothetical protein